jgi:hypothetical protein
MNLVKPKWTRWLTVACALATILGASPGWSQLEPAPREASGSVQQDTTVLCVVRDGQLANVSATVDPQTGDTLVSGRPFAEVFPTDAPHYLAAAEWAANGAWVVYDRRRYISYGTPRTLRPADLVRVGEFRGVPLFARTAEGAYRSLYLPIRPGCEFQLYHFNATVGEVRG